MDKLFLQVLLGHKPFDSIQVHCYSQLSRLFLSIWSIWFHNVVQMISRISFGKIVFNVCVSLCQRNMCERQKKRSGQKCMTWID